MTRKEREREFKKKEILDAAIQIFSKKGFKATTLDEIAEKSEFGKGTIYNYFSNKEEIYREIIIRILNDYRKAISEIDKVTDNFYDFLLETTKKHISFCLNNKEAFLLIIFTKMHHAKSTSQSIVDLMKKNDEEIVQQFIAKAKTAVKKKEIRKLSADKVIRLFKATGYAYIYDLLVSGELSEKKIDEEAKFIADVMFNGINIK